MQNTSGWGEKGKKSPIGHSFGSQSFFQYTLFVLVTSLLSAEDSNFSSMASSCCYTSHYLQEWL